MPKRREFGLERLVDLIAERIKEGVTEGLRKFIDEEFAGLERRMAGRETRRGPGRPPGRPGRPRGRRRGRPPKAAPRSAASRGGAASARRERILNIVKSANGGISSVDVAKKMKVDARGVGILLSRLAKEGAVKKEGTLYRPA